MSRSTALKSMVVGVCLGVLSVSPDAQAAAAVSAPPVSSSKDDSVLAAAPTCTDNSDCNSANRYCAKAVGDCDGVGHCRKRPQACPENYDPVCGCDGQTYSNKCFAAMAGVNVDHLGECEEICGGITGIPCDDPNEFCKTAPGECCCDFQGVCTPIPQGCPDVWDPVCGCDGVTYGNECEADAAGVSVDYEGECIGGGELCGGFTGIPCEDPNDFCKTAPGECCCDFFGVCTPIPNACPDVWDPVCGCDGMTYGNECEADAAGVSVDYEGACGTGKCCSEFGCSETTQEGCDELCGNFAGVGTVCTGTGMDCPEPPIIVAACCLPDGSCEVLTQCQCEGAGGTWQNTADCSSIDCAPGEICGGFLGIPCEDPNDFCKTAPGECCCDFFGVCTPIPMFCPLVYDPVCGCDGQTYTNECFADAAGVSVDHAGPCTAGGVVCQTNADCQIFGSPLPYYCAKPVGQCDGPGECQVQPQACLDVWDPVCGCDGQVYSNDCYAAVAGVNLASNDICAE